jgi:hypothetical protein
LYEESTHPSLELLIPHFSSFTCNIKGALTQRLSLQRWHDTISTFRHCCSGSLSSRCSLLFFFLFDLVALLFSESYNLLDFLNLIVAFCRCLQRTLSRLDIGVASDTASEEGDSTESKARVGLYLQLLVAHRMQPLALLNPRRKLLLKRCVFSLFHALLAIVGGTVYSGTTPHTAGFDSKRLSSARQNEKVKGRSAHRGSPSIGPQSSHVIRSEGRFVSFSSCGNRHM